MIRPAGGGVLRIATAKVCVAAFHPTRGTLPLIIRLLFLSFSPSRGDRQTGRARSILQLPVRDNLCEFPQGDH